MRVSHRPSERGFTLIELMIVVVIIGILSSMMLPKLRIYLLNGRLEEAKPYLMALSAKQRMYRIDNGKYCCTSGNFDGPTLTSQLGVDLTQTGNFCFVFVCRDSTICQSTTTTSFITPSETGDPTVQYEIWAILRTTNTTSLTGPNSVTCTMDASKLPPTGWVLPATSTKAGHEGTAMVLRYPPPPNGVDAVSSARGVKFDWIEGISTSDATH